MEKCQICQKPTTEVYTTDHKRICSCCYYTYLEEIGRLFSLTEALQKKKFVEYYTKNLQNYLLTIKKYCYYYNKPVKKMFDNIKQLEQEFSINVFNQYRNVMLQDKQNHLMIMNKIVKNMDKFFVVLPEEKLKTIILPYRIMDFHPTRLNKYYMDSI